MVKMFCPSSTLNTPNSVSIASELGLTLALPVWSHLPSDFQGILNIPNLLVIAPMILDLGPCFFFLFNSSVPGWPGKLWFILQNSKYCFFFFDSYFFNHIFFWISVAPVYTFVIYKCPSLLNWINKWKLCSSNLLVTLVYPPDYFL